MVSATRIGIPLSDSSSPKGRSRRTFPGPAIFALSPRDHPSCGRAHHPCEQRDRKRERFHRSIAVVHRLVDEVLYDPTQTIELLAVLEGKIERSIRMTLSLAVRLLRLGRSRDGGSPSARFLR